jgi:hypothetical protein
MLYQQTRPEVSIDPEPLVVAVELKKIRLVGWSPGELWI